MKKTVLLITSLVLMVGCIKSVEDSTLINKSGLMYFKESDEPYSGRSFSKDSEGNIVFKFFYRNGKKIIESDFENSEEGKTIVFYENGQKDTEYEFDLSIKSSIKIKDSFKKWYDNGNKRVEGHYVNGERNGVWTEWDENGQKKVTQYSTPSSPSTSIVGYDWCTPNCSDPTSSFKFSSDGSFNFSTIMFGGMSRWGTWKDLGNSKIQTTDNEIGNQTITILSETRLQVGSTVYVRN